MKHSFKNFLFLVLLFQQAIFFLQVVNQKAVAQPLQAMLHLKYM